MARHYCNSLPRDISSLIMLIAFDSITVTAQIFLNSPNNCSSQQEKKKNNKFIALLNKKKKKINFKKRVSPTHTHCVRICPLSLLPQVALHTRTVVAFVSATYTARKSEWVPCLGWRSFHVLHFGCLAISIRHEIAVGRLLINLFINFNCRLHRMSMRA